MAKQYKPLDENGLLFLWQQILAKFVVKVEGKGLSTNDLTDELLQKINDAGSSSFNGDYNSLKNIPTINGIQITGNKTLDDLGITKAITDAVGKVVQISLKVVDYFLELPVIGTPGTFYLVPNGESGTNKYDEYIWDVDTQSYELLGQIQQQIDLTGYVKEEQITPLTNEEILEIINSATE